jgi:hypothetical protein
VVQKENSKSRFFSYFSHVLKMAGGRDGRHYYFNGSSNRRIESARTSARAGSAMVASAT